ncbi:DeoR/GlpR family DNA-binding transcription regulator [Fictibacillus enclensis]|uniref:DeoR/GlpR family DNA-binding transcription regulator n=1 Tax=Fictibacillus enclensis TaxID=1017270 RepID=UPI00259FEC30|nr:DeoR/GlpR family DNA-binding transcription regulator [Fictibacillus enclensis]MDM5339167.1 DeoR/GlpR family DNA-binding transcription regulator [Fictibacillus enclensis]
MDYQPELNSRQNQIYKYLINEGEVKISELTDQFNVVEMTIRRDFEKMEKLGLIKRTFGGAISLASQDVSLIERESLNIHAKKVIGMKAAEFVKSGEAIFIDAGTTTSHLVRYIPKDWNLVIVTNALNVASKIQGVNKEKIVIGGMLLDSTLSMVGPIAESALDNLTFNKAFLAATSFSLEQGFTNSNLFEVQIKQKVMRQSKEVNFLIDHSKFGNQSLYKIASPEGINRIITDREPAIEYRQLLTGLGVELVICDPS